MRGVARSAMVLICAAAAASAARAGEPLPVSALSVVASPGSETGSDDAIGGLLVKAAPALDAAPVDWRSSAVRVSPKATLRIRVGDPFAAPGRPPQAYGYGGAQAYELSLVQDWPAVVSFKTQRFAIDLTPHAGLGVTSFGGLAEGGATLQLSRRVDNAVVAGLGAMGVRDGARLGGQGRWYLFAAASGRAVGLNMLRSDTGWARAGWTTDATSTLVGDAQLGVGWRKGAMQTSLGFIHREMKGMHPLYGQDPKADSLVAFSFAVRPGQ